MDWSKAKNILIIAFIVTNIFLTYSLQSKFFGQQESQMITDEYVMDVEKHLNNNGIHLDVNIPREIVSLPILMVRYHGFDAEQTASKLLGKDYQWQNQTLEDKILKKETFKTDDKELIIDGGKRIQYMNYDGDIKHFALNEKTVSKISNDFLKQNDLLTSDIELSQVYYGTQEDLDDEQVYKLVYNQKYKNKFLGESYIHVYVSNRGVVKMEAMLLEYEKTQQQKKAIIPAADALTRAMGAMVEENDGDVCVSEIELGYYFSPSDYMESDWKEVVSGTAFPSWKITIDNGKTYFVEAYKN